MADFVKLAATAKRLIEKNGRAVRLAKSNRTPSNPSEPWRGNGDAPAVGLGGATLSAIACMVPADGGGLGRLATDVLGQVAVVYDQVALVASDSVSDADLSSFDRLVDVEASGAETVWKIVARGELRPASKSLMWVLGVKR